MGWEITGTIAGPDYIINPDGIFLYNGTPGLGNLAIAITPTFGTDQFGNNHGIGFSSFGPPFSTTQINAAGIGMFIGVNPVIEITDQGLFFYLPSGGAGNLVASISQGGGIDSYGNHYLAGNVTYTAALASANSTASMSYYSGSQSAGWTYIGTLGAIPGQGLYSDAPYSNTAGTAANPTHITTDIWHTLGALSGTSGYTVNQARYTLTTDGFYEVDIVLSATATATAGSYTFANSLPAGPLNARSYPLGYNGAQTTGTSFPSVRIGGAGSVVVQIPALPTGTVLSATQRIPVN